MEGRGSSGSGAESSAEQRLRQPCLTTKRPLGTRFVVLYRILSLEFDAKEKKLSFTLQEFQSFVLDPGRMHFGVASLIFAF